MLETLILGALRVLFILIHVLGGFIIAVVILWSLRRFVKWYWGGNPDE